MNEIEHWRGGRWLDHHQLLMLSDWLDERDLEREPPPPQAEYDDTDRKRSDDPSR
jgi:hypothetical protein